MEEFLNLVIREIDIAGSSNPTRPLPFYFQKVLKKHPSEFLFCSTRFPKNKEEYVRVMEVMDFFKYNVEPKIKALYERNTAARELYCDLLKKRTVNANHHSGEMKGKDPCNFFWATTADALVQISNTANIINVLGLYKYLEGHRPLCIYISKGGSESKSIRVPTTLDSMGDYVFLPSDNRDGYGTTLNLETLEEGAKEILVEKLSFNKKGNTLF